MLGRWSRVPGVPCQPARDVVAVELLAPDHAGERASHDEQLVLAVRDGRERAVELLGLRLPLLHQVVERRLMPVGARRHVGLRLPPSQAQLHRRAGIDRHPVPPCRLRPEQVGVDRVGTRDDMVVDAVLRVARGLLVRVAEEPLDVGLVVAEHGRGDGAIRERGRLEVVAAGPPVLGDDRALVVLDDGTDVLAAPVPVVAEPHRRQDVDGVGVRPHVRHADAHRDVGRGRLRVVDVDLPVPVGVEDPRVHQLELGLAAIAGGVLVDQPCVGVLALRVVVAHGQPGMRRGRVAIPPVLLGILAVIALVAVESEEPLLQVRITTVPEADRQADVLPDVAESCDAVLAPSIGTRARVVVGEVPPGVTVRGVVLAHRPPGPLRQVGAPQMPGPGLLRPEDDVPRLGDACPFGGPRPWACSLRVRRCHEQIMSRPRPGRTLVEWFDPCAPVRSLPP